MQSVFEQTFTDYEYIIIDGGSTDGSKEYIEQHADKLAYWVSEKDGGVYEAMNKGIKRAAGDYLWFLNGGDVMYDNYSIKNIMNYTPQYEIVYGNLLVDGDKEWVKNYPEKLTFDYFLKDTLPHPATVIKKDLFNTVGLFNENLKIVSDWEFFIISICKQNVKYIHVNEMTAIFRYDGMSSLPENTKVIEKEKEMVLQNHFPAFLPDYIYAGNLSQQLISIHNSRAYKVLAKIRPFINWLFNK